MPGPRRIRAHTAVRARRQRNASPHVCANFSVAEPATGGATLSAASASASGCAWMYVRIVNDTSARPSRPPQARSEHPASASRRYAGHRAYESAGHRGRGWRPATGCSSSTGDTAHPPRCRRRIPDLNTHCPAPASRRPADSLPQQVRQRSRPESAVPGRHWPSSVVPDPTRGRRHRLGWRRCDAFALQVNVCPALGRSAK